MASKTLSGFTVVELASVLAGPLVGNYLAELGAHVIKVEHKGTNGDVTRQWKTHTERQDTPLSSYYAAANMGKETHLLDLNQTEALERVQQWIAKADVVICNLKPSAQKRFGLSFKQAKDLNPTIIYAELKGYPNKEKAAYDAVLQAETGYMSINGEPGQPPLKLPLAFMDILAAQQLKQGVLEAIIRQNKQKTALHLTVSLYEAAIAALANQASAYLMNGETPKAMGSAHPNIAPYGEVYTDKEGKQFVFAIGSNAQFQKLCSTLDIATKDQQRFSTNELRLAQRKELTQCLQTACSKWNRAELLSKLEQEGVPAGAVHSISEVFQDQMAKHLILEEEQEGVLKRAVRQKAYTLSS